MISSFLWQDSPLGYTVESAPHLGQPWLFFYLRVVLVRIQAALCG